MTGEPAETMQFPSLGEGEGKASKFLRRILSADFFCLLNFDEIAFMNRESNRAETDRAHGANYFAEKFALFRRENFSMQHARLAVIRRMPLCHRV
jgi:hypothetical protein